MCDGVDLSTFFWEPPNKRARALPMEVLGFRNTVATADGRDSEAQCQKPKLFLDHTDSMVCLLIHKGP